MKIFNRILNIALIIIILIIALGNNLYMTLGANKNYRQGLPVRVGVFTRDLNDDYEILLRKDFEDIQKNNPGKVEFSFYNADFDQLKQNMDIENALNKGIDLILLDIVNVLEIEGVINTIEEHKVPVIVYNTVPVSLNFIKSHKKVLYVGTDSEQGGTLQGKMIVDAWNKHQELIDKNKDNVLQYVLLVGAKLSKISIDRSAYAILTIQQARIKAQELESPVLDWNMELAESTISAFFLKYGNRIEAIISNDDTMAIGAVKALQKSGYNKGNKLRSIPVVGVDGVLEAKELISKGFMLGTALQNHTDAANAIYTVGMNLVYDRNPVEGLSIPYKLDETGAGILIPYEPYTGPMFQ